MTVIEIIGFIGSSLVIWDHVPQIIRVQRGRVSGDGGTVKPSASAVLMLVTEHRRKAGHRRERSA